MKQLAFLFLLLVSACATAPRPTPLEGPTAQINDRMQADDDESNLRFFVVAAVDGQTIPNAVYTSGRLGMGFQTTVLPYIIARHVEVKRARYTLLGTDVFQTPFSHLVNKARGRVQRIEGDVTFEPKPGVIYRVNGELSAERSAIWIEEFETGLVVSERITSKP